MVFVTELLKAGDDGRIPHDVALEAFRIILPDMVEHFSLRPTQSGGYKRVKTGCETYRSILPRNSPCHAMPGDSLKDSSNMAYVLCYCLTLGLIPAVDQIISKILVETHAAPVDLFDTVLLPIFKDVVSSLLEQGADLTEPRFRLLFQHGLAAYIDRYVQPEPTKPTDWTRSARGCGRCSDCRELDSFLRNPNLQIGRFSKLGKIRKHLEQQLYMDRDDYKFDTDKNGSPHTLVIKKTSRISQFGRDHDAWKQRGKWAIQNIQSMGIETLRKLLGDQFNAIISLKSVQKGAGDLFSNRLAQEAADDIEVITID